MPFRLPHTTASHPISALFKATTPLIPTTYHHHHHHQQHQCLPIRCFHSSPTLLLSNADSKNHYERLNIHTNASPGEIKKSFYALSKVHHPDANPSDPNASTTFSLLSESYTVLSDPSRRAAYDRDVLRLHHHHHHPHNPHAQHHGSYYSTNPAGGRAPSGLSRRKGTFRGPPPSFYRSGGWGTNADKRRKAHEESTGTSSSSSSSSSSSHSSGANPWASAHEAHTREASSHYGGMGPGSDPFHHEREEVPHFDKAGHTRTHQREDSRRWRRERRAVGDDDMEFEPQTSLAGHFFIVAGILAATFLAPAMYLQAMRLGKKKEE